MEHHWVCLKWCWFLWLRQKGEAGRWARAEYFWKFTRESIPALSPRHQWVEGDGVLWLGSLWCEELWRDAYTVVFVNMVVWDVQCFSITQTFPVQRLHVFSLLKFVKDEGRHSNIWFVLWIRHKRKVRLRPCLSRLYNHVKKVRNIQSSDKEDVCKQRSPAVRSTHVWSLHLLPDPIEEKSYCHCRWLKWLSEVG